MLNNKNTGSGNALQPWLHWRAWLPSRGSVLLVFLAVSGLLIYERRAGAFPHLAPETASTAVIPYQGSLADSSGNSLDGSYALTFRIYTVASSGSPLWTETWTGGNMVTVDDGLFSLLLGSLTPIAPSMFAANSSLWLGITVGSDSEMMPRVQLGSAPFAIHSLAVPDESITAAQIANTVRSVTPSVSGWNIYPVGHAQIQLPDTGTSYLQLIYPVPQDYAGGSLDISVAWRMHDAAGVVKLTRTTVVVDGDTGATSGIEFLITADVTSASANEESLATFSLAPGGYSAGDFIKVTYSRSGDLAGDTAGRLQYNASALQYLASR